MRTAELLRMPRAALRHTTHLFDSVHTAPFDTVAYSRMKFGCWTSARALGREMADAFASEQWSLLQRGGVLIIPAPSTSVPVASTLLARAFAGRLNHLLDGADCPSVELSHVQRTMQYMDDYAKLPAEQRKTLLGGIQLYLNTEQLEGKTLVFVDDVRITGTHETKLSEALDSRNMVNSVIFATFAAYSGENPAIEHELNSAWVRGAEDVAALSGEPGWTVTPRALRMILSARGEQAHAVLTQLSACSREALLHAAIVTGYHKNPAHEDFYSRLRDSLKD